MKKILFYLSLVLIAGCSEEIKSAEYFSLHLDEAEHVYTECVALQKKEVSENCINARKAILHVINNRFNYEGLTKPIE